MSKNKDKDDDNNSLVMITGNLLFAHGSGVGRGGCDDEYSGEEGNGEDDLDVPNTDDAVSMPDAEVDKYSFLEHLHHYMEGNKISDVNMKCVEWAILFEVGTLVRNMDTMRTADMEDSIFGEYVNMNTSRSTWCMQRCCIGSSRVRRICLVEICCMGGRVNLPTYDHSGTNFKESVGGLICQVDPTR